MTPSQKTGLRAPVEDDTVGILTSSDILRSQH